MSMINRRDFLATSGAAATVVLNQVPGLSLDRPASVPSQPGGFRLNGFRLNYAPHVGTFRHLGGDDPVDQIRFMAGQGFRAFEDVGLLRRSATWRARVGRELRRQGMTPGAFVATSDFGRPTFASGRADLRDAVLRDMGDSLEAAAQWDARWLIVMPGKRDPQLPAARQFSHAVDLLQRCAALCEAADRVLLLESLPHHDLLLTSLAEAHRLCRAVDSPACRMLVDVSRQQVSAERLLPRLDRWWNEIGYFQVGDNPGRKEPGSGRFDFHALFQYLAAKNYAGVIGMDHGNSLPGEEGEERVLAAYREHDVA